MNTHQKYILEKYVDNLASELYNANKEMVLEELLQIPPEEYVYDNITFLQTLYHKCFKTLNIINTSEAIYQKLSELTSFLDTTLYKIQKYYDSIVLEYEKNYTDISRNSYILDVESAMDPLLVKEFYRSFMMNQAINHDASHLLNTSFVASQIPDDRDFTFEF